MPNAKQSPADQAARLSDGRCPVHGRGLSQIEGWFTSSDDNRDFTIVGCSREGCSVEAKAFGIDGPFELLETEEAKSRARSERYQSEKHLADPDISLYCYHIAPIDFWYGAITKDEMLETVRRSGDQSERHAAAVAEEIENLISKATEAFKQIGWEGDTLEGPFFFAVPSCTRMQMGYILKQENNGDCFVASPIELPENNFSIFKKRFVS